MLVSTEGGRKKEAEAESASEEKGAGRRGWDEEEAESAGGGEGEGRLTVGFGMTKLPVVKHNPRRGACSKEEESGRRETKRRDEVERSGGVRRRSERRIAEGLTFCWLFGGEWSIVLFSFLFW